MADGEKKTVQQGGRLIDEVLESTSQLDNLEDFLLSSADENALVFWLKNFSESTPKTLEDIQFILIQDIALLDEDINLLLNQIIHHKKFQALESAWRGLWSLVIQGDGVRFFKLKLLDISWQEVTRDVDRAIEFDQSQLFQKIYSEEYGSPGGEPYGTIITDFRVSHRLAPNDDIATLAGLASIGAAAFAPIILSTSPEIFGLDDFSGLGLPLQLDNIFSQKEYIRWHSLREHPDSRFIGLTLPYILMRAPYRKSPGSYKGVYFEEKLEKKSDYLWGSASYGFARVLIREFAQIGWFGHIRGVPRDRSGGGLVQNLITDTFNSDVSECGFKPVTDVVISDKLERQISILGFIPLCQCHSLPLAAFYNNPSIQSLPPTHDVSETDTRLSGMMQHVLCASRIAHYIKVMIRDKVGSFVTAEECERYLQEWLFKYTTGNEDLEWEEQARFPLKEAQVAVNEHPEKPGQFTCIIRLAPHYQLDQLVSELELVTELGQAV